MSKNKKTKSLKESALVKSEIKVIHGTLVEEPKCKICNTDLSHEWLGGDYTLLVCDKLECLDKLRKMHFVNNLTVGSLIENLNFAIENGYITNEHTILIGGNGDTCLVQNLTLPAVILDKDKDKEFKQVQMLFTKF